MPLSLFLRAVLGRRLTIEEGDENSQNIMDWVEAHEDGHPGAPNGIGNIVQEGTQLTIFLQDGTPFGPFTLPSAVAIEPVVTKANATMTLATADRGTYMRCTHASGCLITIPLNDDDPIPVHSVFHFRQCTSGGLVFEGAATDVTINGINGLGLLTDRQGAVVTLKKVGTDEWDIFGLLGEETTGSA